MYVIRFNIVCKLFVYPINVLFSEKHLANNIGTYLSKTERRLKARLQMNTALLHNSAMFQHLHTVAIRFFNFNCSFNIPVVIIFDILLH